MKLLKFIRIFINVLCVVFLCFCVPEEVILHGNISGAVIDAETSQPLPKTSIELKQPNNTFDTTRTGSEATYLLKSIPPGDYEINASKETYGSITKNITVNSASTTEVDFELSKAPYLKYSDTHLDFGDNSIIMSFTISNIGSGTLPYFTNPTQDWITVNPQSGEVTTETDTIKVTIDRAGFSEQIQKELISITSYSNDDVLFDTVHVFVNGLLDKDENYYGVVTIGTQTWMAENLNTGISLSFNGLGNSVSAEDNNIVEKYCYENVESNCDTYGGLYMWYEMMDYPTDTVINRTTQGICPAGWHIPAFDEWELLIDYLGGVSLAGGKMKAVGTIEGGDGLWREPNTEATNESGFTGLPGGRLDWNDVFHVTPFTFLHKGTNATFWTTDIDTIPPAHGHVGDIWLLYKSPGAGIVSGLGTKEQQASVRCIKDQ